VKRIVNVIKMHGTTIKRALVGFTISQATKALRENRGIAVLYF
jgi:hypothetical protein